jgi:hypothetical protein
MVSERREPQTRGKTMNKPKFEVQRSKVDGAIVIDLIVRNATFSAELDKITTELGYRLVEDISNCRKIRCTTPAEVDAARAPLISMFDAKGEWK